MSDEIRISGIVEESIVDGPGLRYVLFTQGCPHHCKGCHNPTTHPFDGGRMVSPDWVFADVRKNPIVRGVTFSGGEPFVQSGKLAPLAERLRAAGYNLTSYTGYLYEELLADSRHMPLLRQLDILVDGPFILEEKSLIIRFRGSRNQRIIDVPRSLAEGRVVLHQRGTPEVPSPPMCTQQARTASLAFYPPETGRACSVFFIFYRVTHTNGAALLRTRITA